ncbi:urea active transporter [Elsinoe ampelina]|uniref:Urea active transporter n=1 Tax=Elsinoe ampelina TaxID=302913 RepID=A0A6A6G1G2_9PEZI|nr:urea active transporter [Elsinoe ampelina]
MAGGIGQGSGRPPPLSQAVGYGVIVGLGFLFAFGMMLTTYVLRRYNNELQTSEVFSTAGRTVKTGLIASAVVSSWTWAATLLQSSAVAYRYGVSGPFWYASGATVQIILFATIAIELKRRAPNAHTFLEVIRARYGPVTHGVFMVFALMTNILVTAMLLAGGSAVTNSLTGVPTAAACFLLPVGVVLYTVFGGIKATFLTDYVHTVVILVILFIFSFSTYATNSILGSPGRVWDALRAAAERHPVEGNAQGSYLTMRSREGGIFFVINIIGNFGTVFMDNGYWFAIPWLAATAMGLAALSLEGDPSWPTYPERMASADVSAGLVLPEAAVALLGAGGAAAVLIIVFMAVTSAMSAQLIAVSSIATYDVYQTYINPQASGRRLIWTSHMACVVFATVMAGFSTGLYYAGISLGYLYLLMGVIISGAVIPASLTLLWERQSWAAATFSPPLALACSLTGWLVQASREGPLTVEVTGANNPMLVGNVVALLSPMLFVPVLTFVFPSGKYDWKSMAAIRKGDDSDLAAAASMDLEQVPGEHSQSSEEAMAEMEKLHKSAKIARVICVVLTLALLILWPMPLYGSGYVFSRPFFTGWIVVGLIWLFISTFCVGLYPLWEGRFTMMRTTRAIYRDVTGKGRTLKGEEVVREEVKAGGKDDGDKSSTDGEKAT